MPTNTLHFFDFLVALDRGSQALMYTGTGFMVVVGMRWFAYLTAMMIVSCGVSSAWRHEDWGMVADRFRSLVVAIAITYSLLQFYSTPIPITGLTFPQTINETALQYSNLIAGKTAENMMLTLGLTNASLDAPSSATDIVGTVDYGILTLALLTGQGAAFAVMVFGHVGQGVALVLGPLFIPWMMVPKLEKVFWAWLSVFLTFAIYPLVASSVLFMFGNAMTQQFSFAGHQGTLTQVFSLPVIFVICLALIYGIFKIPQLAYGLMSGVAHSDFGEMLLSLVYRAFR